jgi:bifunctional non-homologous end joining protein LigD
VTVPITHPEKVLFPGDSITKGELAGYYQAVAAVMVPHLRGRPVTMERYPAGIEKKGFIQKDVSKGYPEWLERIEVPKKDGSVWYPLVGDARSLLWTVNQNCITPHVWASRLPDLGRPDICVFDLDPAQDEPLVLRAAALAVCGLLDELGLPSWIKTSGSKGFHIAVPLDGQAGFDLVWQFAHGVAAVLVKRDPAHLTQEFIKADRDGRILVDTGRNQYGATFAAAYAVRPKPGAPVSAPCTRDEVERGAVTPRTFTLNNIPRRLGEVGDLWADLHHRGTSLRGPMEQLRGLLTEEDWIAARAASTRRPATRKRAPAKPRGDSG